MTDEEMNLLNNDSKVKAFISFTKGEGFGRPLLEAMQCGTPIVCSNNSSIPEVVGDAALKSDCYDVDSFVKNIVNLLTDEKFYLLKRNEGLERAKIFNLKNFHDKLINIYSTEINNFI